MHLWILALLLLVSLSSTAWVESAAAIPPQLSGENFRITVLQEGSFLEVHDEEDGTISYSGYLIDMLDAIAQADRANFTYELVTPSGYGSLCEPRLDPFNPADSNKAHGKAYRTQYNCGASDVNDLPLGNFSTDMYLGLYYVTPARQLQNQFTMPYSPPTRGTLAMYGTATGIQTFEDLVQKQKAGEQPPACAPGGTALLEFVQESFPGLQVRGIFGADKEIDQAFMDGTCQVYITDAPLVTQFVLNRSREGRCTYNGAPVGLIGEPMSFGLSHYAIGVRRDIPTEVVDALSYWMNILMSCNSLDPEGPCPDGNFADLYAEHGGTGSECGYVSFPPPDTSLSPGATAGVVVGIVVGVVAVAMITYSCIHRYKLTRQAKRISLLETYRKRLGLLDKVAEVQRQYLESGDSRIVYSCLLEGILNLMDSEYGFIGEMKIDESGTPYLHVHASTNRSTVRFSQDHGGNMRFYNMDSLFGRVLTSKKPVVSNSPHNEGGESAMPIGQYPLQSFLGIPFSKKGGEISGMIAIANKPGGYTTSDVEFLAPFSATVTNLIQAFWQIAQNQHLINTLEGKVKERTSKLEIANSELEEANRRVVQASAAQLKHFACMSHEIRTPLNCIIGLSSLLQETELSPSQEEEVRMIVASGDLLLTVVNDVLDYSKLESGNVDITIKECNLQETLNAVVHSIVTKSKSKRLIVQTSYDNSLPGFIRTDGRRVQQIAYNLLGNAAKFSYDDGIVELTVSLGSRLKKKASDIEAGERPSYNQTAPPSQLQVATGSDDVRPEQNHHSISQASTATRPPIQSLKPHLSPGLTSESEECTIDVPEPIVRFSVKDHGKGINKEDFSKIFEPFSQATAETENVFGGTGLGLAITSKLVHALSGTISVDSVEGEWSEFTVELPFRDSPADVTTISRSLQNAHIVFVSKDVQLANNLGKIFQAYNADYTHHSAMNEVESMVERRTVPIDKFHVCLVHEDLFVSESYERIKRRIQCALLTYGPMFAVKETEGHFRGLVHVFPSVLMSKIGSLLESTGRETDRSAPFVNPRPVTASVPYSDRRFLIVEDNAINQKVLQRILKRMGVEHIAVVGDGKTAVDWEARNPVDCIFMDYQMPEMDGVEACRRIVSRDRGTQPRPKIVFVTAHVSDMFENECREAGGSGFLPKPFNFHGIEDCLEAMFS